MTDGESPADRRYREWQEREKRRKEKEQDARDRDIDDRISAGMNDREARGRDSCLVMVIALGAVVAAVVKGVTGL